MIKLLTANNFPEAGLLKSQLELEGIECILQHEGTSMATGSIPLSECMPELWLLNDVDAERALALIASWQAQPTVPTEPWVCPSCNETNEGQFGECWHCGQMVASTQQENA